MDKVRTFIAIDMPQPVMETVHRCQEALRQAGLRLRWIAPKNVHLTLRFLGDVSMEAIFGIGRAVEKAAAGSFPFALQAKGVGVFPGRGLPRVVWVGLEGEMDALDAVYRRLNMSLAERGIPSEKRPFKGHLTIGRVKGRMDADFLRRKLDIIGSVQSQPFRARRLVLYKSDLTQGGAVYTPIVKAEMGKRS